MKLTHYIAVATLGLALPFGALADAEKKAEHISEALGLEQERADQVKEIFTNYEDQKKELKEQKKEQLQNVLTEDEYERLESMKEAKREMYKEHRKDKWKDKE